MKYGSWGPVKQLLLLWFPPCAISSKWRILIFLDLSSSQWNISLMETIIHFWSQNICMKICRQILIWVEEQTYWIASRFLMLGFELDLYSTGEYCMVYWYMYIILIKLAERTHMRAMTSNEISKNAACSNHLFFPSWCNSVEQFWIYILGNLICGFLVFCWKFCCTRVSIFWTIGFSFSVLRSYKLIHWLKLYDTCN